MESVKDYRIHIRPLSDDEGGGWYAEIPELPGCVSDGETPEEAFRHLQEAKETWIQVAKELNRPIPEPLSDLDAYSGKFTLRLPKSLHRSLAIAAETEGVSLNQYILFILAERHGLRGTASANQHGSTVESLEEISVLRFKRHSKNEMANTADEWNQGAYRELPGPSLRDIARGFRQRLYSLDPREANTNDGYPE